MNNPKLLRSVAIFTLLLLLFLNANTQTLVDNNIRRIPGVAGYSKNVSTPSIPVTRGEKLAESYSLKRFAPPVGDQSIFGTCVGWATTYAGMTILENMRVNRNGIEMKEEDCMSPQLTYDLCRFEEDSFCTEGTFVESALNALVNFGALPLSKYPKKCKLMDVNLLGTKRLVQYDSTYEEFNEILARAKERKLSGFISAGGPNIIQNVKYYLSKNMPVIIASNMYQSIEDNTVSGVWNGVMNDYPGGHAMCVIGYDDTKEGGAFEILNSWGDDWSENGYVWFRYRDFEKVVREAYALKGIVTSEDTTSKLNNFGVRINAIGKISSQGLPIECNKSKSAENSSRFDLFQIGGLQNQLTILYPTEETSYSLSVRNETSDGFWIYGFFQEGDGLVSLVSSGTSDPKYFKNVGEGMILPISQNASFPLSYDGEICILLSKIKLETEWLDVALEKKYRDLHDFVYRNFEGRIAINNLENWNDFDGGVYVENRDELNQIQPLFFDCKKIYVPKPNDDLIRNVEIFGLLSYSSTSNLKYDLKKFKRQYSFDDEYDLKIEVHQKEMSFRKKYSVSISVNKVKDIFSDDSLDTQDEQSKEVNRIVFETTKEDLEKNIKTKLIEYFVDRKIYFSFR